MQNMLKGNLDNLARFCMKAENKMEGHIDVVTGEYFPGMY